MQFKENQTIYLQIAERISDEILLGHYAIGSRIPSVREYAALVEVNAVTSSLKTNYNVSSYRYIHSTFLWKKSISCINNSSIN